MADKTPSSKNRVDFSYIEEMFDNDSASMGTFCEAGLQSFQDFQEQYKKSLRSRDIESLTKVGHRIKPTIQMLNIDDFLDEYYHAKELIASGNDRELEVSIERMMAICEEVKTDFHQKKSEL